MNFFCWMAWRGTKVSAHSATIDSMNSINFINSIHFVNFMLYSPQLLYPCTVIILFNSINTTKANKINFCFLEWNDCFVWWCVSRGAAVGLIEFAFSLVVVWVGYRLAGQPMAPPKEANQAKHHSMKSIDQTILSFLHLLKKRNKLREKKRGDGVEFSFWLVMSFRRKQGNQPIKKTSPSHYTLHSLINECLIINQ